MRSYNENGGSSFSGGRAAPGGGWAQVQQLQQRRVSAHASCCALSFVALAPTASEPRACNRTPIHASLACFSRSNVPPREEEGERERERREKKALDADLAGIVAHGP